MGSYTMNITSIFFNKKNIYKDLYVSLLFCIFSFLFIFIFSFTLYAQNSNNFCTDLMIQPSSIEESGSTIALNRYLFRNL